DEVMRSPGLYALEEGEHERHRKSLKLLLEKKLAVLERAIESNPSSVDLKLAKLQLCAEFWEPSALAKEWQKLLFLHPNNTGLWQRYLSFCQSQFGTFSVSKLHSLYGKCLSTLSAVKDGSILSHPVLPGTEEAMFALFLQHCHFLRQAGHSEKVISLFQAMLDFTFFKPDSVKELPTKVQVLFDDIGQSLIRLSSPDLQFQLIEAFLQFLGVPSGFLPPASCLYLAMDESSIFDSELYDEKPLTYFNPSFSGISCVGYMEHLGCPRWTKGHSREGEEFVRNVFHLVLPLFSGKHKSQLCLSWLRYEVAKVIWCLHTKKKRLKSQGKCCKKLAKNLLKEPENRNNFCLWKQYAHLEWLLGNIEDARKVFDTALSMAGSSELKDRELCELSLLYAELEMELSPDLRGATTGRAVHVLMRLTESSPYGPYTGQVMATQILKARKAYEHALQDCLGQTCVSDPAPAESLDCLGSLVKCFMLFQYLTVGIDAAVQIYGQVFAKLKGSVLPEGPGLENSVSSQSLSSVLEAVTLMHTSLLRFHMNISAYPLLPLRETLSEALKLFPGNQVLWRAYVQIQNKSHSANKTRRFFNIVTRSAEHLEPWLFAIEAEKMRKRLVESVQRVGGREVHATIPETGLTYRIRALFENAIRSDKGSQCPLLWRMYLNFLVSLGNKERSKGVFYKALQSCPWAKVLYMDAMEYFPEELQEILDVMTEKELRVRLPLEELDLLLED
ncbi:hypothetical protein STEG23_024835, partial [Scotinomys teguina]